MPLNNFSVLILLSQMKVFLFLSQKRGLEVTSVLLRPLAAAQMMSQLDQEYQRRLAAHHSLVSLLKTDGSQKQNRAVIGDGVCLYCDCCVDGFGISLLPLIIFMFLVIWEDFHCSAILLPLYSHFKGKTVDIFSI